MDAGCSSEAWSNKRRVSNKRRSDRSALDAKGVLSTTFDNNPCTVTTSQSQSEWNQETSELKTLHITSLYPAT